MRNKQRRPIMKVFENLKLLKETENSFFYEIPNGFWDLWKTKKNEIKSLGYSCYKYSSGWLLTKKKEEDEQVTQLID